MSIVIQKHIKIGFANIANQVKWISCGFNGTFSNDIDLKAPAEEIPEMKNEQMRTVNRISHLLDSRFTIPGTNIRFGLDPIVSLFPVAGDLATTVISLALINTMRKHGASEKLILKMTINIVIDFAFGSIPILGTIFDVYYKANNRNVKLLREFYEEGKHRGSGKGILILTLSLVLLLFVGIIYGIYLLINALV